MMWPLLSSTHPLRFARSIFASGVLRGASTQHAPATYPSFAACPSLYPLASPTRRLPIVATAYQKFKTPLPSHPYASPTLSTPYNGPILSKDAALYLQPLRLHTTDSKQPPTKPLETETPTKPPPHKTPPKARSTLEKSPNASVVRWLLYYIWPPNFASRVRVLTSFACLALSKVVITQAPVLLGYLVNAFSETNLVSSDFVFPTLLIVAYPLARIFASGLNEFRNMLFVPVSQSACRIIACNSFWNLHNMDIDFLITNKSGEIAAVIRRGIKSVTQLLNMMLFQILPTLFEFALVLYVMSVAVGLPAAAITSVTMLTYVTFTLYVTGIRTGMRKRMNQADQTAAGLLQDSLTNAEAVRYFTSENEELRRYENEQRKFEQESIRVGASLAFLNFGQQAIFNAGLLGCFYLTAAQIVAGVAPVGHIVMISTLLFQLAIPLNLIGSLFREFHLNLIDLQKLHELLTNKPALMDSPNAPEFEFKKGHIRFDCVDFEYASSGKSIISDDSQEPLEENEIINDSPTVVFKNLSFDVKPGTKVAIVGPSGSGKSTLVKLLFRFYDVQNGGVYIDEQNVKDLSLHSFRKHIGVVPQEVLLFNETILFNLKYGSADATFEQIKAAVKLAQLEDVINALPEQYNTIVGERGIKLSGGEKQRVGVARCILRNPSILVFDEATSALDVTTERRMSKALREVSKNRTVLVIAHRLSTVVDADKILLLGDGRVEEEGTHQELLAKPNSKYKELWRK